MKTVIIKWSLVQNIEAETNERYCHNCGRKVLFTDSSVRRHNANGKNIYQFSIYKCKRGHTWNKKLDAYKAQTEAIENKEALKMRETPKSNPDILSLSTYRELGVEQIEIHIEVAEGKWRLDKLLAQQIDGLSRSQINHGIRMGQILVNDQIVKPNMIIRNQYKISLILS